MSQQNHPRRRQQSDASYRPKDSFRQEESAANRNNRCLSDRIHLPLKDRLELPNYQDYSFYTTTATSDRMDFSPRNDRYFTRGEGARGTLDERIGGLSEHSRGTGGKPYVRHRREEPMNYDDKPTQRNFEDRVFVDNRTLEERISGATPTSARKFSYSNGNEGNVNKLGNSNPPKQSKKGQNKEDTNGGTIVVRNTGNANLVAAPASVTTSDEAVFKQGDHQQNQPIIRQEEDMDAHIAKKNLQLEGPSASTATTSPPSPIATSLQEQLREKALASMKNTIKKKAQAEAKEKDMAATTNPQKAKSTATIDVAAAQVRPTPNFEEPSALSALERHLNPPVQKSNPEIISAITTMLAEVQASSSGAEERRAPLKNAVKGEDSSTTKEEPNTMNTVQQASNVEPIPSFNTPKPIPNIADKKPRSPKEVHIGDKNTRKKESEAGKENETHDLLSENQPGTSVVVSGQSDTRQKLTKLPPLQTSTPVSQTSSGKPSYRHDKSGEDDDDYWRKEKSGPYSAPIRHHPYNSGRRLKDADDAFDQPGLVDRRPRYWEDRPESTEREYKRSSDDVRRRPEKQPSRTNIKEEYREDVYRSESNRGEEVRDQFYASQRLPQLPPLTRTLLSTEDYTYPPEYPPYNAVRYLPIRGEERQSEYDPYYKDLAEWLEITGFHDVDYRQTALRRHRERELDRLYAMRVAAASVSRDEIPSPVDRRAVSASNLMPPPQLPGRAERGNPELALRVASRMGMYPPRPPPPAQSPSERPEDRLPPARYTEGYPVPSPPLESVGLKRRIQQEDQNEGRRPEKSSRTAYDTHPRNTSPRLEGEHFDYRGGRPDPVEGGPNRRGPDVKEQDEASSPQFRRVGRPSTPVREIQEKLAARSPSPGRFHENEQRRAAFKEGGGYKGRLTEDDQGGNPPFRPGKKLYEKIDRRGGSPDASPRMEKSFYRGRGGYNNSTRYHQLGDASDHRSQFGYENDDGFRSPGRGNFGYRRGSFDDSRRKSGYGRGGGDHGRDWYNRGERREKLLAHRTILGSDQMDVDSPSGAISTDTRYFIVKSFNHDNVIHAQRDGIWATQEKNAEIFNEAFNTARDVILIFSVNKSGKFQGYARMESAPGTAEMPPWTKGLLWQSSGAFYIRWITICDVGFYHLAPLLNRMNEDQPVFIGRDGQEIDPETGAKLCSIVDEGRVQ